MPHTPGPWKFQGECVPLGNRPDSAFQVWKGDHGPIIAEVVSTEDPAIGVTEGIANARLIAAAADLLAALTNLLDWAREHTSPIEPNSPHTLLVAAHAAIAKATQ